MRTLLLVILSLGFMGFWGCAPEDAPVFAEQRQSIIDGEPDTDPAHMAVVALWDDRALCSGTLITPRVVLTAGHCVYRRDATRIQAIFGNSTQGAPRRQVDAGRLHPDYNHYQIINDVALLHLSEPAPEGVEPIPILPAELGLTDEDIGKPLVFSGFGKTDQGTFTNKMTVSTILGYICDAEGSCSGNGWVGVPGTICYDQELGGPCSGDSGGPAFVKRDGVEYVAGITSYGDWRCAIYGCSTQVDRFEDFIQSFAEADKGQGAACSDASECYSGYCADGVCCDYACERACEHCAQEGAAGRCLRVEDDAIEEGCGLDEGCATAGKPPVLPWIFMALGLALGGLILIRRR